MYAPVDIAAVRETEERLRVSLPSTFVSRMMRTNGGEVVIEEEEWSLHPFLDTRNPSRVERAKYDIIQGTVDARKWEVFPEGGVAIATNGLGDELVFLPDAQRNGQLQPTVFMWSHETGELDIVAKDFGELELESPK